MSNSRQAMPPERRAELDAWIAEQHKNFVPSDLDPVIAVIQKADRLKAMAAAQKGAAA